MSATDELRAELTKRGVEWSGKESTDVGNMTEWECGKTKAVAMEEDDGTLGLRATYLTPAQAIAATLGRGECHDEGTFRSWGYFTCSNCKVVVPVEAVREAPSIGKVVPISFCPNCGKRVEVSE